METMRKAESEIQGKRDGGMGQESNQLDREKFRKQIRRKNKNKNKIHRQTISSINFFFLNFIICSRKQTQSSRTDHVK